MKKYVLVVMMLIMFFLISCKPIEEEVLPHDDETPETPEEPVTPIETEEQIEQVIRDYLETIVLPKTTKENLVFLKKDVLFKISAENYFLKMP